MESKDDDERRISVRAPASLLEAVNLLAGAAGLSQNAYVVRALRRQVREDAGTPSRRADLLARLEQAAAEGAEAVE